MSNYKILHFIIGIITGILLFTGIACGLDGKFFFNKFYNPIVSKYCSKIGIVMFTIYNVYQIFNFLRGEKREETAKDIIDYYVGIICGILIEILVLTIVIW